MKNTAYGKPILISSENIKTLEVDKSFSESEIQNLIFNYPEVLPISKIDESFNPAIPICMELNTPVGPMDVFMISPDGEIILIETKLWRNPEARRKVIAQILDYAKELTYWAYEDLQREVNRKLNTKGNSLYNKVKEYNEDLVPPEADFIDSVSRNLSRGNFLLLIVGDGIREGTRGISEFLSSVGHLNFTLSLVELKVYHTNEDIQLVVPNILMKTVEIAKMRIEVPEGLILSSNIEDSIYGQKKKNKSNSKSDAFYSIFWEELIKELNFDDPSQVMPNHTNSTNLYVYPGQTKKAWISAYFMQSGNRVGVYFKTQNDSVGNQIIEFLNEYKDEIISELGDNLITGYKNIDGMGVRLPCKDVKSEKHRERIKAFFKQWLNEFVNVLRPKLKKYEQLSK